MLSTTSMASMMKNAVRLPYLQIVCIFLYKILLVIKALPVCDMAEHDVTNETANIEKSSRS